ncbi:hypothetical protein GCM10009796_17280 [Microbacterium koreense]
MLVLILLAIIAVIWLLIAQPWRGSASDASSAQPEQTQAAATSLPAPGDDAASATAAPEETTDAEATPSASACAHNDILVEAVSDQDSYGSGVEPQLSIRVTNDGEEDCTLNVGTTTQVFTVTSGNDTWWRSTDCQTEPSDMVVTLAAGQTVESATPVVWDRTRSAVGTCDDANRPAAPGGGASYHVTVEIGGVSSAGSKQILLY